ncbi:SWI/SNF-related matrix-associated actin-dependent regulator of chromatin subfamily D member 1 [Trichinella britovi]|uniref:SWI/SNF-related matrix-associated actin-dependent regulator of chromatin subfamily D member 1 n=1 Tax=Trichinella britovi TaxID=45882 RepID=A0A0V1CVD5_TRIBR|nr:SWI/SNF-related matrix-associated actin-dependent regulator of chromatin subfamily D member 1 [Trichinella britovi]KRZ98086.1 SWI/SNF-related matrix-associated actin-dependent regulator of chromatin subfamily D member 1 [Trichinella sp. T8]
MSQLPGQVFMDVPPTNYPAGGSPAQMGVRMNLPQGPRYFPPGPAPVHLQASSMMNSPIRGHLSQAVQNSSVQRRVPSSQVVNLQAKVLPKKPKRVADREIPVAALVKFVPEAKAYADLLAFEQKLDMVISRKRANIQEALKRPLKIKRKLRIFVSHTFISGKAMENEEESSCFSQWELRVEGRLLEDLMPSGSLAQTPEANRHSKRKFSSFFKTLIIELDKELYGPDSHLVEWHRTAQTTETDGFQVKRPGDQNPMKYKLDPRLGRLLGVHTETRIGILEALWQYIVQHKLQDHHERDLINFDRYLEQIFQCQRLRFMEIPQRLNPLLQPPDPIIIHHIITVDGNESQRCKCYDVDDDPCRAVMMQFLQSQQSQQEICAFDAKIFETVDQIKQLKLQRDFFLRFAEDPQGFLQHWLLSECKDLKNMHNQVSQPEADRRSEFYDQIWMKEAVKRFLHTVVLQKKQEVDSGVASSSSNTMQ